MTTKTPTEIAPFPTCEAEATADSVLRHLVADGLASHRAIWDLIGDESDLGKETFLRVMGHSVDTFGMVLLLRALMECDPAKADEAAKEVWSHWHYGDSMGEWLHQWATELGMNADEIAFPVPSK